MKHWSSFSSPGGSLGDPSGAKPEGGHVCECQVSQVCIKGWAMSLVASNGEGFGISMSPSKSWSM